MVGLMPVAPICLSSDVLMIGTGGPTAETIPLVGAEAAPEIALAVWMCVLPPLGSPGALNGNTTTMPYRPTALTAMDPGTVDAPFYLVIVHLPVGAS